MMEPRQLRSYITRIIQTNKGWVPMSLNDYMALKEKPELVVTREGKRITDIKQVEGWIYSATVDGMRDRQVGGMDIVFTGSGEMEFDVVD